MTPQLLARCVDIFDSTRRRYGSTAAMARVLSYAVAPTKARRQIAADASALDPCAVKWIELTAERHGIFAVELTGERRRWKMSVRDEAVHVARAMTGVSFPALARYFGRDHSSLVQGERRFEKRLAADDLLRARIERLIGDARAENVAVAAMEANAAAASQ